MNKIQTPYRCASLFDLISYHYFHKQPLFLYFYYMEILSRLMENNNYFRKMQNLFSYLLVSYCSFILKYYPFLISTCKSNYLSHHLLWECHLIPLVKSHSLLLFRTTIKSTFDNSMNKQITSIIRYLIFSEMFLTLYNLDNE